MSLKSQPQYIKATHTATTLNYRAILEVDQDTNRPYDLLLAFCRVHARAESNLRDAWDRHNNQGADIRQVWQAQDRVKLVLEAYDRVSSTAPKPA